MKYEVDAVVYPVNILTENNNLVQSTNKELNF